MIWRLIFLTVGVAAAQPPLELNHDGGWCWFQDKRALIHEGKLSAASISRGGEVQVTTLDLKSGAVGVVTLRENFMRDDHNVPGMLLRSDGRLMAFYTMHHVEARMYYRVTARPFDASAWEPEQSYTAGLADKFTYANPFELAAENHRLYNFWRGRDHNPTWSASDDGGRTWSAGENVIYYKKGERPYVKYASNGRDTIHFAFTQGHPDRPYRTSLYHAYYRGGELRRSDGGVVRRLADGPITPAEATRVYDGQAGTGEATPRRWTTATATPAGRTQAGRTGRSRSRAGVSTSRKHTTRAASPSIPTTPAWCTSRRM